MAGKGRGHLSSRDQSTSRRPGRTRWRPSSMARKRPRRNASGFVHVSAPPVAPQGEIINVSAHWSHLADTSQPSTPRASWSTLLLLGAIAAAVASEVAEPWLIGQPSKAGRNGPVLSFLKSVHSINHCARPSRPSPPQTCPVNLAMHMRDSQLE